MKHRSATTYEVRVYMGSIDEETKSPFTKSKIIESIGKFQDKHKRTIPVRITKTTFVCGESYSEEGWELAVINYPRSETESQLHLRARKLIKELYPTVQLMEEVPVQLRRGKTVYLDFYINTIKLVIEVHGAQHYKYNTLYHSNAQDFVNQRKRDADKRGR